MILNNKIGYNFTSLNNRNIQNNNSPKVSFTAENTVKDQNNVQSNNSSEKVSFFGQIMQKVYENTTSSLVKDSLDFIA